MVENGLEPFSESDVQQSAQLRAMSDCSLFIGYGDWNQDGRLDATDIIAAQQFICDEVGCDNTVDTSSSPFGSPRFFGYLSFLFNSTGILELNSVDVNVARDFILGEIACN